ncbi:Uncharacterised protein [BD1-7 clade bacterium]|uniref:Cadherin domain-containing protein n=1 Tax=BD1-7 clade bacterium TaxID=2029982 RepID=A0A5S9NPZ7_9GAMM|nr:Uncharacterised protein [BD1-7 clade bacterium]
MNAPIGTQLELLPNLDEQEPVAPQLQFLNALAGSDVNGFPFQVSDGHIVTTQNFDYESRRYHQFLAVDSASPSGFTEVTVYILDESDVDPEILISESVLLQTTASEGDLVAQLQGQVRENVQLYNWQITSGNDSGIFAIDAATGKITVANAEALESTSVQAIDLELGVSSQFGFGENDQSRELSSVYLRIPLDSLSTTLFDTKPEELKPTIQPAPPSLPPSLPPSIPAGNVSITLIMFLLGVFGLRRLR